jgi:hypothetical protein
MGQAAARRRDRPARLGLKESARKLNCTGAPASISQIRFGSNATAVLI